MTHSESVHDLLVIGGGINGVGIAADAAGRGLDVVLCEKGDLASATSSSSSKLIHGGLRYLEYYEFSMVRKALREREVLTRAALHLIRPLAFQIPRLPHSRKFWMLRAGLFLYDNLSRRQLYKGSRSVRYAEDGPLNSAIRHGFEYWDGQVDDSRLVILNALQASAQGATILPRTECVEISSTPQGWQVRLRDRFSDGESVQFFKAIVNATGPWVASILENLVENSSPQQLRLVKGSHIVVPRLHDGDQAFLLQHEDGRAVFVIPYLQQYSLIGTTEEEFAGDLDDVQISTEEIIYLISTVNLYFKNSIARSDIVYTYAGVRPLVDEAGEDATTVSREYLLDLDTSVHPIMSVYGGKITTYRILAEEVVDRLASFFPGLKSPWTRASKLPGGDFDMLETLVNDLTSRYAWLGPVLITRWQHSYGTLSFDILGEATGLSDLGVRFGANLYQKEVDYLCTKEWARSADDILWRRSNLGFSFSAEERSSLGKYIKQSFPAES